MHTIDRRSIHDVRAADLVGFRQCHFFAGIGGWIEALRLSGWPADREVWTGSCPCQPFSSAGKQLGTDDVRHLWPVWRCLIAECRPATVFGEQVAGKAIREWFPRVRDDLEELGYAVGAAVVPACSVGAPHRRYRLFFGAQLADAGRKRRCEARASRAAFGSDVARRSRPAGTMGNADGDGSTRNARAVPRPQAASPGEGIEDHTNVVGPELAGLADPLRGLDRVGPEHPAQGRTQASEHDWMGGQWDTTAAAVCIDGKLRRVPGPESGIHPLAYGISGDVGRLLAELPGLDSDAVKAAKGNRKGRIVGYGNAIVPQVAATFIQAFIEAVESTPL